MRTETMRSFALSAAGAMRQPTSLGGIATVLETRLQKPPLLFNNVGNYYSVCGYSEEASSFCVDNNINGPLLRY